MNKRAHAKINICLDITAKRPDGYHDVAMVMTELDFHDDVEISPNNGGINIEIEYEGGLSLQDIGHGNELKKDKSNIMYKAAELIINEAKIEGGVDIKLTKRIPLASGLGGGSADGAAVLMGIAESYKLKDKWGADYNNILKSLALKLGADVPFFLRGGTALCEGIGEIITPLRKLKSYPVLLVKPNVSLSTRDIYNDYDALSEIGAFTHPDTGLIAKLIDERKEREAFERTRNILENASIKRVHIIDHLKKDLTKLGSVLSLMTGSGPTVYGLFENAGEMRKASAWISKNYMKEEIGSIVETKIKA